MPALVSPAEAQYGATAVAENPDVRRTGAMDHAILMCDLCLTASFPGTRGVLHTYSTELHCLLSSQGLPRTLESWASSVDHVSGCHGIGNANALSLRPARVSPAIFAALLAALPATPRGPWTDVDHGMSLRSAQAAHDRYQQQQFDEVVAGITSSPPSTAPTPRPSAPPISFLRPPSSSAAAAWSGADPGEHEALPPPPPYALQNPHGVSSPATAGPPAAAPSSSSLVIAYECAKCFQLAELVALYPCGHVIVCEPCGNHLLLQRRACPVCRLTVQDVLKLIGPQRG